MIMNGQTLLDRLGASRTDGFAVRFSKISTRLGLGVCLTENEVNLLYQAAFYGTLCNIAFNGLGGCGDQARPARETNRIILEQEFMAARNGFLASQGWQRLCANQQHSIRGVFFHVTVDDDNLFW